MNATCSYCYNRGHNRMGCPKAKERATEILPQWEAWQQMDHDNPYHKTSTYRAAKHFDWPYGYTQALDIHIEKQARSRKTKVCNFCGETGHNKRTCQELKDFKADLKLASMGFRKAVVSAISQTGQGIGAMFSGEYSHWDSQAGDYKSGHGIGLITEIAWHRINLFDVEEHGEISFNWSAPDSLFRFRWSHGHTELGSTLVGHKYGDRDLLRIGWRHSDKKLISPSTTVNPPEGWLECEDRWFKSEHKEALKGRKSQSKTELRTFKAMIEDWKIYK